MSTLTSSIEHFPASSTKLLRQWSALQVFNGYRIFVVLAVLFISQFSVGYLISEQKYPELFFNVALGYLAVGLFSLLFAFYRYPSFKVQVMALSSVDIIFLVVLVHTSTDLSSGLGILINVVIASSGILLTGKTSLFFAALASMLLLFQQAISFWDPFFSPIGFLQVGVLGASFFATAILAHVLTKRVIASEALASQRGIDLANLEKLNEYIIQRLSSGIIVIDNNIQIRLINESACQMLEIPSAHSLGSLEELSVPVYQKLKQWYKRPYGQLAPFRALMNGPEITAEFMSLSGRSGLATLIFLDNASRTAQRAQEMKLASLGRFTASIAHELRNPLGAVSHAVQLLQESPALDNQDRRLAQIIDEHSERMNIVIKNILQLSRRKKTTPCTIELKTWLANFVKELKSRMQESVDINIEVNSDRTTVLIDQSQLQQVLMNLCENGLRHSKKQCGKASLKLCANQSAVSHEIFLEVIDQGEGISSEVAEHLFEPFYTTERMGTGLGLYLAKELCEANQARLEYVPAVTEGACFRITFNNTNNRIN